MSWPDVIGILVFVVLSIVARYAPRNSAFWSGVRSIVADYSQRNLSTLPANVSIRVESADWGEVPDVVILVGDKEVRRFRTDAVPRIVGGKIVDSVGITPRESAP